MKLLDVNDLPTEFATRAGAVHAVDGVSLSVDVGETLGIVGESGCGKLATALSIISLLPRNLLVVVSRDKGPRGRLRSLGLWRTR